MWEVDGIDKVLPNFGNTKAKVMAEQIFDVVILDYLCVLLGCFTV